VDQNPLDEITVLISIPSFSNQWTEAGFYTSWLYIQKKTQDTCWATRNH